MIVQNRKKWMKVLRMPANQQQEWIRYQYDWERLTVVAKNLSSREDLSNLPVKVFQSAKERDRNDKQ